MRLPGKESETAFPVGRDGRDFFSRRVGDVDALFDRYLPAYWARTVALTLDRLPGNAVAGDENLTRQIGAFVVGDVGALRPRRTAARHQSSALPRSRLAPQHRLRL